MTMRARLTLVVLTVASFARGATAEEMDGVVAIGGTVEPRDLATISTSITATVREAAWSTSSKPPSKKEVEDLLRCTGPADLGSCFPVALTKRGARRAIVVTAEKQQGTDGSLVVVLTGKLVTTEPAQVVVQQRRCAPCTDDALAATSAGLGRKLLDELAVRLGRTLIAVTSNPEGANITLDGERIGATPMTAKTYPGPHVVKIEKAGYVSFQREVEATEGTTADVTADLQPVPPDTKRDVRPTAAVASRAPSGWWYMPAGFVAAGGVLAIGGVAAVYLGQQDGPDDKTRYTRATPIGVSALLVGVAAAGYGAFRLWRGPGGSAPVVAPTESGAVIGLGGRF